MLSSDPIITTCKEKVSDDMPSKLLVCAPLVLCAGGSVAPHVWRKVSWSPTSNWEVPTLGAPLLQSVVLCLSSIWSLWLHFQRLFVTPNVTTKWRQFGGDVVGLEKQAF